MKAEIPLKLKKARTCGYCHAIASNGKHCLFGYETEDNPDGTFWRHVNPYEDTTVYLKPSEPCAKPVTGRQYAAFYKYYSHKTHRIELPK